MSANYPPPQQQPAPGQNPYAPQQPQAPYGQQPPAGWGGQQQPQGGWGGPQPQGFDPAAYPPPGGPMARAAGNPALGILVGVGAMLVAAVLYGLLIKGTKHEIGYAALGVGALVGLALGKIGGRHPALPFVGVPLALLGVYFGQIFGLALIAASVNDVSVTTALTDHYSFLQDSWKDAMDAKDILFFGIAGLEGFLITKRVAN
ncbi:hypothetical protein VSR01_24485 [Actinacidiphila sp. DG2A-62]|uniref:hypothetical protein n=1 Tax=Actinacidiphila sp. DG2A-62 TaxID=3108821 RepID=UPI002DB8624C|nr:hypothetical protein [Actinacidiphila sp. DG2A-62]MEC3996498.1 hypothetical protein [Actinacidiphila sp. DG2A-62]